MPSRASLLADLRASKLERFYSNDYPLDCKYFRLSSLLEEISFNNQDDVYIARCPGRISLSKHADYINNDLLYILDDRDIFVAAQLIKNTESEFYGKITLINQDDQFPDLQISTDNIDSYQDTSSWTFYPLEVLRNIIQRRDFGLILAVNSDLPDSGGLSSSHALILSTAIALTACFDLVFEKEIWILKAQNIEHKKCFNSGLGDQSAQLLGKLNCFTSIKLYNQNAEFYPETSYHSYSPSFSLITVPSFIKADKSSPELREANINLKLYKEMNNFARNYQVNFLGDLISQYNEKELWEIIFRIQDLRKRGLTLYALAEALRLRELKNNFSIEKLSEHLNLSHQAEINYIQEAGSFRALSDSEKLNYLCDQSQCLSTHSGIYLASTQANDELQAIALKLKGVLASSLTGAGFGGNNIILCETEYASEIKNQLIEIYYSKHNLEDLAQKNVHVSKSSQGASLII